ncbi:hypothetical protein [Photorhabdus viridis]|uniref:hypothetical protein n=1 Tax=Photorhabdus viridis TaxID=3163327 RepID=UPI003306C6F0
MRGTGRNIRRSGHRAVTGKLAAVSDPVPQGQRPALYAGQSAPTPAVLTPVVRLVAATARYPNQPGNNPRLARQKKTPLCHGDPRSTRRHPGPLRHFTPASGGLAGSRAGTGLKRTDSGVL